MNRSEKEKQMVQNMINISLQKGVFIDIVVWLVKNCSKYFDWGWYLDEFGRRYPKNKEYLAELKRIEENKQRRVRD